MCKIVQIFLILAVLRKCSSSPLFLSIESTPASVISDFRQNKRTELNIDHSNLKESIGNRLENIAAIVGKLFGSVRYGVKTFLDDIKIGKDATNHTSSKYQAIVSINETLFGDTEYSIHINNTAKTRRAFKNENDEDFMHLKNIGYSNHYFFHIFNNILMSIFTKITHHHHNATDEVATSETECSNLPDIHTKLIRILRIYKTNKNAKHQEHIRITFQKLFYKYVRIYLIARKEYKNFQGIKKIRKINFESEEKYFATSEANRSKIESVAILFIEIFGTLVALFLGIWTQIEYFDWSSFE